jgi:DNA-binding transcriptional MerR regulator
MESLVPSTGLGYGLLKIGEAATLTGVSPGRIRHYQSQGLIHPARSLSGYRYFNADDLVLLLEIDLLRSLGIGLAGVRDSLLGRPGANSLLQTLRQHRTTLQAERDRLERLLAAVDLALESEDASSESVAALLASANSTPRDSLGIFGRLSKPLSEDTAAIYQEILGGGWGLPVPSIFSRMLLPAQVTELMEQVARAGGYEELFHRIRELATAIVALASQSMPSPEAAQHLALKWLDSLELEPIPREVQSALDRTLPRIRELEVLNQGFQLWAESISPLAAEVLRAMDTEARHRSRLVLGVLVTTPVRRRPPGRTSPRA